MGEIERKKALNAQKTNAAWVVLTLDHLPTGSRLTPRLTSACAKSRLRVLSALVRMVMGRGTSLASNASMSCVFV